MKGITIHRLHAIAGGILFLSGLLASGCGRPKDVLSDRKMIEVITDLKLAEAYCNSQTDGPNTSEKRESLAKSVLAKHGVTQEQLDTTLGWYGRNLDKYAELYEKVDKRLVEKRKTLLDHSDKSKETNEGDNLWPYGKNGLITSIGNSDGWVISLSDPDMAKGDRLEWTMHVNNSLAPLIGVLGVEYDDGTSEAVTTYFTNRPHIELSFQSDTGKLVKRIYGTMRLKKSENMPLYADSITLRRLPYDTIEYRQYRSQKRYGYPIRVTKEDRERKAKADSIRRDSLRNVEKLRKDSLDRRLASQRDSIGRQVSPQSTDVDKPKPGLRKAPEPEKLKIAPGNQPSSPRPEKRNDNKSVR